MPPALFHALLLASLVICTLGVAWRVRAWLRHCIGPDARGVTAWPRVRGVLATVVAALVGPRGLRVLGTFCLDALLLRRLFENAPWRALAHLCLVSGFTLLVLLHALGPLVTAHLFPGYQPTVEPWLFVRNLLGAMVLGGLIVLVVARRRARPRMGRPYRPRAALFATLLGVVVATGFLLEAHKIASPGAFHRMTDTFAGAADPAALASLRTLWAREYGVAFDVRNDAVAADVTEAGRQLHETSCVSCHAKPAAAFVSWPLAKAVAPVAGALDAVSADAWLLHLHVLACFAGLALLPFTTFLHVLAAPFSLLLDAAARHGAAPARPLPLAARATRRALSLDACVRCGMCDLDCSVAALARHLDNRHLLPSHKLVATRGAARLQRREAMHSDARALADARRAADGAFLCTDCGRCTRRCPVGLDLAELWDAGRGDLDAVGLPAPAAWVRARPAIAWAESLAHVGARAAPAVVDASRAPLAFDRQTFSRCVQCQTCTNVCPVVAHAMAPDSRGTAGPGVDLTPQKVMNLLRLGLPDLALGSRMVWDCATCYQCQEHCPEGIRVADIMCELRAWSVRRLASVRDVAEQS
jgi:heterodisulfide reductase subunit C/nitrate reductase gamma subunit